MQYNELTLESLKYAQLIHKLVKAYYKHTSEAELWMDRGSWCDGDYKFRVSHRNTYFSFILVLPESLYIDYTEYGYSPNLSSTVYKDGGEIEIDINNINDTTYSYFEYYEEQRRRRNSFPFNDLLTEEKYFQNSLIHPVEFSHDEIIDLNSTMNIVKSKIPNNSTNMNINLQSGEFSTDYVAPDFQGFYEYYKGLI